MNAAENLMVVAQEECAEIQQNLSKALRFGVDNHHPDRPEATNGYEILKEFTQLKAVIDLLIIRGHIRRIPKDEEQKIYHDKMAAVNYWEEYSKSIGLIKEETV